MEYVEKYIKKRDLSQPAIDGDSTDVVIGLSISNQHIHYHVEHLDMFKEFGSLIRKQNRCVQILEKMFEDKDRMSFNLTLLVDGCISVPCRTVGARLRDYDKHDIPAKLISQEMSYAPETNTDHLFKQQRILIIDHRYRP